MLAPANTAPEPISIPLRWADLDAYGHVHHAAYLNLLEEARFEWLNRLGATASLDHVIVDLALSYQGAIPPGSSPVKCTFEIARLGHKSFTTHETMRLGGRTVASADAVFVAWDREQQRSRPLRDDERDALSIALVAWAETSPRPSTPIPEESL